MLLNHWWHPTIWLSVTCFSSHPQSFPASESFPMSQLFASGNQSIGASASASFLPVNTQGWFPLGLTKETVQGTLKSQQPHNLKAPVLRCLVYFMVQLSHPYMTTGKTIALTIWTFVGKVMSLLLKMLSKFIIAFLRRSKHLLISWLQSPSAVILEPKKIKTEQQKSPAHPKGLGWVRGKTREPGPWWK